MVKEITVEVAVIDAKNADVWDAASGQILALTKETKQAMDHAYRGSAAIGASIIELSRNAKIKKEFEKFAAKRKGKKGRPPVITSWIPSILSRQYEGLPTAKHMANAAKVALALEAGGSGTMRELLGWDSKKDYKDTLIETSLPQLPSTEKPSEGPAPTHNEPHDIHDRIVNLVKDFIGELDTFLEVGDNMSGFSVKNIKIAEAFTDVADIAAKILE